MHDHGRPDGQTAERTTDRDAAALRLQRRLVDVLDRHLDDDAQHSTLLDPFEWAERSVVQRASERVSDVVSGWL